jgi:hypothetical protein
MCFIPKTIYKDYPASEKREYSKEHTDSNAKVKGMKNFNNTLLNFLTKRKLNYGFWI